MNVWMQWRADIMKFLTKITIVLGCLHCHKFLNRKNNMLTLSGLSEEDLWLMGSIQPTCWSFCKHTVVNIIMLQGIE